MEMNKRNDSFRELERLSTNVNDALLPSGFVADSILCLRKKLCVGQWELLLLFGWSSSA